ncbi:hypothetical protein PIB30_074886 [Stylosanthes scabra]|uniref:Protein kinase domain-containing protein n=1 Tax=Stylosanthes scabra TaxID=79078 RepID=A0ABU6VNF8_9FABA|nr:hypothetical protein [Stylosanthes scabra]
MEQFRQIGEALGSLKALMLFKEKIQINQRQCCLVLDVFTFAYDTIADEIKHNLKFEERNVKWKGLEQPLKEIHKIFKEGESYVRNCLETKDWWAKAIILCHNTDSVELHIHNLLCCMPFVIEVIESAGEASGTDQDDTNKRKWILQQKMHEKKMAGTTKQEKRLIELILKNLQESCEVKLIPSSTLVGSKDFQVKRRMGNGQYKEIAWLGESFVIKHFTGEIEAMEPEIREVLSLSHPNIMDCLCGFTDDDKKECFLLMELMSKTLSTHIKEIHGPRKQKPFLLHVAIDVLLQIARGMEYLHSKKVYNGELNPSNILVKPRGNLPDGYLHAKVTGFRLSSAVEFPQKGSTNQNQNGASLFIWYAPEVLEEQENSGGALQSKYSEKSDVYSFGMVCFELLTGKVPFEDSHLQGEKMSRNIRAGERPLFSPNSPKYIVNLTKKCWHTEPDQRPSFSSI